jgi:hypothetical protein
MTSVWILQHVHAFDDGHQDVKMIGVFTTEELAQKAIERVKRQPGFRDLPQGFDISELELDRIGWQEGYITIHPDGGI